MALIRVITICGILLCGIYAKEERAQDPAISDKLIQALQKRIADWGLDSLESQTGLQDERSSNTPTSCEATYEENTIIKTSESQTAGAVFIDSPDVSSRMACKAECCKAEDCSLAVYKDKGDDTNCYLFFCGHPNVCLFSYNKGYVSIHINRTVMDKHENDLAQLATEPATTSTTTTVRTTTAKSEPVPLFGQCEDHKDCDGSFTKCLAGFCVCSDGNHPQEGTCRRDCRKFEFECANIGAPLSEPACIAIYDLCDGVAHCGDGSDEAECSHDDDDDDGGGLDQDSTFYDVDSSSWNDQPKTVESGPRRGNTFQIAHNKPNQRQRPQSNNQPPQRPKQQPGSFVGHGGKKGPLGRTKYPVVHEQSSVPDADNGYPPQKNVPEGDGKLVDDMGHPVAVVTKDTVKTSPPDVKGKNVLFLN